VRRDNAAGDVISYEEFHPWGTTAYHAGTSQLDANPKRYRYSGKERDAESGLYYVIPRRRPRRSSG
jgi:hypothetical protein